MAEKKKIVDLSTLDTVAVADSGAELTLKHPQTREPLEIVITLHGSDSNVYQKATDEAHKSVIKRQQNGLAMGTREEAEDLAISVLAECTKSWAGVVENGKEIPCDKKEAVRLYKAYPWIREQVSSFIESRGNFIPPSNED